MKSLRCVLSSSEAEGLVASQTASNKGLELTASSVRCAPAFGSSSGLAFGVERTAYQLTEACDAGNKQVLGYNHLHVLR
jgi:hypothetical protein